MTEKPSYLPDVLTFLRRHFGVECSFSDYELHDLEITVRDISAEELLAALSDHSLAIRNNLRWRREWQLNVFVGGPLNGQHHAGCYYQQAGTILYHRVAPARWAVYEFGDDHLRAWFRGYATSEAKARKKIFTKTKENTNNR